MFALWEEIKRLFDKRYPFFSTLGYFFEALNFYLYLLIVNRLDFSILFFMFFFCMVFVGNFIFSAITSLYIDVQNNEQLRARDVFHFYGLSEYLTFILIPLAYIGFFKINPFFLITAVMFFIWILRIWMVKKCTDFGFINSVIAVLFPHIIIFTVGFMSAIVLALSVVFGIYA